MSKVSKDQIKHISNLARLRLTDNELTKFEKEFNNILDYTSKIEECDVSGIENEHNLTGYKGAILQDDVSKKSLISKEKMLQNATNGRTKLGYVRTSKIIDK